MWRKEFSLSKARLTLTMVLCFCRAACSAIVKGSWRLIIEWSCRNKSKSNELKCFDWSSSWRSVSSSNNNEAEEFRVMHIQGRKSISSNRAISLISYHPISHSAKSCLYQPADRPLLISLQVLLPTPTVGTKISTPLLPWVLISACQNYLRLRSCAFPMCRGFCVSKTTSWSRMCVHSWGLGTLCARNLFDTELSSKFCVRWWWLRWLRGRFRFMATSNTHKQISKRKFNRHVDTIY